MVSAACAERSHRINGCVGRTGAAYDYGEQKQRWLSAKAWQQHCLCLAAALAAARTVEMYALGELKEHSSRD